MVPPVPVLLILKLTDRKLSFNWIKEYSLPFYFINLYLTISLSYFKTCGQSNYFYTTLNGQNYQVDDIAIDVSLFQAGLGLKLKLLDSYFFRPYIEGGGVAGFYEIKYKNKIAELNAQGSDYKTKDSLFDGGHYGEGGIEISFSEQFGIRAGARFITSQTKKFATLGNQRVSYRANVYYLSALVNF